MNRDFTAKGTYQLWVADITQVRTGTGRLYLAVVLDVWSRRIVGLAMAPRMPADLVGDALTMAITCRQPKGPVVHHSDQGAQYTSLAFGKRCRDAVVELRGRKLLVGPLASRREADRAAAVVGDHDVRGVVSPSPPAGVVVYS